MRLAWGVHESLGLQLVGGIKSSKFAGITALLFDMSVGTSTRRLGVGFN